MTILDKSQNDKKDELIVNENDTTTVISTEVQRSGEISAEPDGVETSNPQCHPESVAERSREDLNPNVIPTSNVISTEVQRSGEISAKLDGVEDLIHLIRNRCLHYGRHDNVE